MMLNYGFLNNIINKQNSNILANSYVANHALQQIEIDLIDMTDKASQNDGYRYAVSGVDIFSKYGWALPIKTKQPHDVFFFFKNMFKRTVK